MLNLGFASQNVGYNSYIEPRKRAEFVSEGSRSYGSDRNGHRGGYMRTPVHGMLKYRESCLYLMSSLLVVLVKMVLLKKFNASVEF